MRDKPNPDWKYDKQGISDSCKDFLDAINPPHYQSRGIECIEVTENMNFCMGNAMKYLWRAGMKDDTIQELKKAKWYIEREIRRLKNDTRN